MAKDKVKVSRIEIEIGDAKLSLTPKQARALFEELRELVGDRLTVYQPNWWYVYQQPATTGTITTSGVSWYPSDPATTGDTVHAYINASN